MFSGIKIGVAATSSANPERAFMQTEHIIQPPLAASEQIAIIQRIDTDRKTLLFQGPD